MTDLTKAAIFTKYPVDKIVKVFTGSFNLSTANYTIRSYNLGGGPYNQKFFAITHGFTRPVFCEMQWSIDGGTTWADAGAGSFYGGYSSLASSDSTSIYIFVQDGLITTHPNTLFTYRILATWIDDYDTTNPDVVDIVGLGKPTSFDSTNNVPKIYKQGSVSVSTSSGTAIDVFSTINHELGGFQNYKVYIESFPGEIWPQNFGGSANPFYLDTNQIETQSFMSTTALTIDTLIKSSHGARKLFYRIYGDV